jgi:UDP-3-O-[3-hydroxymyristoyl] glucosamine N-acyltransferase
MIPITEIIHYLEKPILGAFDKNEFVKQAASINIADEWSISWIKKGAKNANDLIFNTNAKIIIIPKDLKVNSKDNTVFILSDNPRLSFIKVIDKFFKAKIRSGIHPTASVSKGVNIDFSNYIGAFTYIGKAKIGKNNIIHGHVYIYDGVEIGDNVEIHAGTVIGADGFGYERDEDGQIYKFPHIGGVIIEDNVEIGSNTCIDRGSLGNTILRKGSKIDNLVHIAHNVEVGENSFVIANAMVGGSTKIGNNTWIAPSVSLMNGIKIGSKTTIGMSSLVTKDVPDDQTWTGSPARPLKDFVELQQKLKKL